MHKCTELLQEHTTGTLVKLLFEQSQFFLLRGYFLWVTVSTLLTSLILSKECRKQEKNQTGVDFSGTIFCTFLCCPLINHPLLKWQRWCKGWNTTYWRTWKCREHSFEGKKKIKVCSYLVSFLRDLWLFWKDEAHSGGHCSWHVLWCGIWILVNRALCFICMSNIQDLE